MAISQFPPASSGGGLTNDFILDKAGTTNNVFATGRAFEAGGYSVVVTGSTAYDIYLIDADGSAVGYTNGTSIVASSAFESVSVLGLGTADLVAFTYNGPSTDATASGTLPGAGAYLVSISPSDLPEADDTAAISGGNFADDLEISFISGTTVLPAKNVAVANSTAAIVTRPDGLSATLSPWDVKAINPGVPEPTATDLNILAGTVTGGNNPTWVDNTLANPELNVAYSDSVSATDSDGGAIAYTISAGALPTGLTLGSASGTVAGTATVAGTYGFTIKATDEGNNFITQAFNLIVAPATGGTLSYVDGYFVHEFDASGTFSAGTALTVEYAVVAGGGGSGNTAGVKPGGGGAGGFRSSISGQPSGGGASAESTLALSAGNYAVTIGAGGGTAVSGSTTSFHNVTTVGGGRGQNTNGGAGVAGGSGGGAAHNSFGSNAVYAGGAGTTGEGYAGGSSFNNGGGGGGGGAASVGSGWTGPNNYDGNAGFGGLGLAVNASGAAVTWASGGGSNSVGTASVNAEGPGRGGDVNGTPTGRDGRVLVRYQI